MSLLAALKLPALDTLAKPGAATAADLRSGEDVDAPSRSSASAAPPKPPPPSEAPPMAAAPAAAPPAAAGVGISSVQFSIPVNVPNKDFSYVTCGGSVTFAVAAKPEGDEPDVEVKIKNLKPEVEAKLKKKYGSVAELSGGLTVSDKEGSVAVGLDLVDAQTQAKTTFEFHVVKVDAEHAKVEFAALEWSQTYPLARTVIEVGGVKWKVEGGAVVKVTAQPNWKQIAADVLKRLGVTVAEDAALGVAAGGTGTAGAAAIAVASSPLLIAAGGILGGLALTAGAMNWLEALEKCRSLKPGRPLRARLQAAARLCRVLWLDDARHAREERPRQPRTPRRRSRRSWTKAPGTTREQAIDAAKLLGPELREPGVPGAVAEDAGRGEEGLRQEPAFLGHGRSSLMRSMNEVLDLNGRY